VYDIQIDYSHPTNDTPEDNGLYDDNLEAYKPDITEISIQQILDRIHCYFKHSYDLGFKLTPSEQNEIQKYVQQNTICKYLHENNDPSNCPIYKAMKDNYQFTEDNLTHFNQWKHFANDQQKPICMHSDQCMVLIRFNNGGNELKDKCHMAIFQHPINNKQSVEVCFQEYSEIKTVCFFIRSGFSQLLKEGVF